MDEKNEIGVSFSKFVCRGLKKVVSKVGGVSRCRGSMVFGAISFAWTAYPLVSESDARGHYL